MQSKKIKGIYLSLITAGISGVSIFLNKFAVGSFDSPLYFVSIKNLAVTALLISLLLISKKWNKVKELSKPELKNLVFIGLIGGSLPFYLYFKGLSLVPSVNAAIIHKTLVIWVVLFAVPLLKEKLTKIHLLGLVFIFGGNLVIGGFEGFQFSFGEALTLLATILWAVENILAKKVISHIDFDLVALFRMGVGSIILSVATFTLLPNSGQSSLSITPTQLFWIILTVFALFGYVISWYRALKFAPAITVTSILASSTIITNILSAVFITQRFNISSILQTILLIIGLSLFIYAENLLNRGKVNSSALKAS